MIVIKKLIFQNTLTTVQKKTHKSSKSFRYVMKLWISRKKSVMLQSGLSSRAKHGGPVISAVSESTEDPASVPGFYDHLGC